MRELERRAAADPGDGTAAAFLARTLARAGRVDEARDLLRARLGQGEIDALALELVLEVGRREIQGALPASPRANFTYVLGSQKTQDGLVELAPLTVAFAGLPGAGARELVLALGDVLGARPEPGRVLRVDDERVLELRADLARPWVVTPSHAVRSLRLVTVPVAPHAVKLRRQLLSRASAVAFVVDSRAAGSDERTSNEQAWKAVAHTFRAVHGFPLTDVPLLFLYLDDVEEAWHRWLTLACGLRRVPRARVDVSTTAPRAEDGAPLFARAQDDDRVTAHDGAVESLAFLLTGVARAVRAVATPRPRFRRR